MPLSRVGEVDAEDFSDRSADNGAPSAVPADAAPVHPVTSMQGPFEESIYESMTEPPPQSLTDWRDQQSAQARRQQMLHQDSALDDRISSSWPNRPGAKHHPFWKVGAQIAFGIHLLHRQLAKSDDEVVKILHTHVDEVDGFLERTTEDFELAIADINERIKFLKLPLEHLDVFDVMLEDHKFRNSIIDGNEKIERIVDRTAGAMNLSLADVATGIEAVAELGKYLDSIGSAWTDGNPGLLGVYAAMRGNAEGWYRCLRGLQLKGSALSAGLVELGVMLSEMSKRASIASRRQTLAQHSAHGLERAPSRISSPPPTSRYSTPQPAQASARGTGKREGHQHTAERRQSPPTFDRRYENPRKQPTAPAVRTSSRNSDRRQAVNPTTEPTRRDMAERERREAPPRSSSRQEQGSRKQESNGARDHIGRHQEIDSRFLEPPTKAVGNNGRQRPWMGHGYSNSDDVTNGRGADTAGLFVAGSSPPNAHGFSSKAFNPIRDPLSPIPIRNKGAIQLGLIPRYPAHSPSAASTSSSLLVKHRLDSAQSGPPYYVPERNRPDYSANSRLRRKPSFSVIKKFFNKKQVPGRSESQLSFMD